MNNHLAIDIGASSGRLVLGTGVDGKIKLQEIYRFENAIVEKNGRCLWDIEQLVHEIIASLSAAKKAGIDQCTLGIDTWGVDYVLVNENGKRLQEVYSYRDHRTQNAIQDLQKIMSLKTIYQKTGIQFLNFNTLFQLHVHDKHELAKAHRIMLVPDYLYYRLSGKFINEKTNASTMQLLNLNTHDYDDDLLAIVGVKREQFSNLSEPGESVGFILQSLKETYDLPQCELICVATHDTASAILGVPATAKHFAYLSSGTWSLMGVESRQPIVNEQSYANNYTNEWGAYGTFRFLKNIMGLWLIQEVRRCLGPEYSFAALAIAAEKVTPFQFLIPCNAERFLKPDNMVREIQDYCRESGQSVPETAGELARCVFDSLALMYRKTIREIGSMTGNPIDSLHIVGGGTKNEFLCQLTADVIEMPVVAGPVESTALGNILVQMISCNELRNIQEAREKVLVSFEIKTYLPQRKLDLAEVSKRFNHYIEELGV